MIIRRRNLVIAGFLIALLAFGNTIYHAHAQNTATRQEILKINDDLQQKKKAITDLNQQIIQYQAEIKAKEQQVVSLNNQLSIINSRLSKTTLDIKAGEMQIESRQIDIASLAQRINDTNVALAHNKTTLAGLLREIYKNDNNNVYLTLLADHTFSDFLEEAQYLQSLEEGINGQIGTIINLNQELNQEKVALETEKKSLEEQVATLNDKKDELSQVQYAKQILTNQTAERAHELERTTSELRAEWQTLNDEVSGLEDNLRSKLNDTDKFSFKGDVVLSWPVPNSGIVTYFHDPDYPFRYIFEHTGIDIRTIVNGRPSSGLPVHAAAAGIVIKIVRESPYGGNIVYVAHASGIMTVYMHLLRIDVSPNQELQRGDIVGLSGGAPGLPSSGRFTTGPHLHFEVRRNGVAVNPLDYLVSGI